MSFPDPDKPPQEVSEGPVLPPVALLPTGEESPTILGGAGSPSMDPVAGNFTTETGGPAGIVSITLVSGPGYDLSWAAGGVSPNTANEAQVIATFDAAGQLTDFVGGTGKATLAGTHAEFGTAGPMAWGRWTAVTSTITALPTQTFAANDGFHYVVGIPAPITALGGTGTATFNLVGATSPTNGATTGTVTGGQLVVNLGTAPTVNLQNFTFAHGGGTYVMNKAGMAITGPLSPFSGTLGTADFAGSTGACSFTACSAQVNGHFYGTSASHAGFAYKVSGGGPTITGAAAFAR
jgi:hypothetical protein